jgi:hypothetical protein
MPSPALPSARPPDVPPDTPPTSSPDTKSNVQFFPLPPIDWKTHYAQARAVVTRYIVFAAVVGLFGSVSRRFGPILAAILVATGGVYALRMLDQSFEDVQANTERQRGQQAAKDRIPESAEWVNTFLEKIWPLIDSKLFASSASPTPVLADLMVATSHGPTRGYHAGQSIRTAYEVASER